MQKLVLLPDEVALLKRVASNGIIDVSGVTVSEECACEYLCGSGFAELREDELRLTAEGRELARCFMLSGAVWDDPPRAVPTPTTSRNVIEVGNQSWERQRIAG